MRAKVLVLSIYPAPYRVELFNRLSLEYDLDVFFEKATGDYRDSDWFRKGKYYTLDSELGIKKYAQLDIKSYSLVLVYDYASKTGVQLITRCKFNSIPYVINCDGVMMEKHGNFIRDIIKRYLIRGAAGYFASGENAKQYFLKYGANKRKVFIHTFSELEDRDILKRPLNIDEKRIIRKELGLPLDKRIAIAVGRFIPLKRYDALIRSWTDMPEGYTLLLIGGGNEKETYCKIIEKKQLKNVVIKDYLPKEKLFEYYKAADVFVHPTSYDVWGLVLNEAMACGLPVIVSDHCVAGLELIKNGKNGYLVTMGNDQEMCRRVIEVTSDKDLYRELSQNALDTIRPYTMTNMASVQLDAIKEIVKY